MNEFANVQLDLIVSSLTNPRKSFDQVKLQELADSIKTSGVHQPIVLRKLPAARVPDLFSEIKGIDLCIDPPCFAKKEEAQATLYD